MKRFYILVFFILWSSLPIFAQSPVCKHITQAYDLIQQKHVRPIEDSKDVYHEIFNIYMELVDPYYMYFSVQDSLLLHQKVEKATSLCELYSMTKPLMVQIFKNHESNIKKLTLDQLNSTKNEVIIINNCNAKYQSNPEKTYEYVFKMHKYTYLKKKYIVKEAAIVYDDQKILQSIIRDYTKEVTKLISNDETLMMHFIKALHLRQDPHSDLFDTDEKEMFSSDLSKEELSFGLGVKMDHNDVLKVVSLTPGGAAWMSRQIEEGDHIYQIELENGTKYLTGIDEDEDMYKPFYTNEIKQITLYLTKKDGSKSVVKLKKTKIEVQENVLTGYVFSNGKNKVGYIDLPSFYSVDPMYGGNGCASDMAREILQLKKDSIQGLIIDLRNNGGGLMREMLEMAGLFIDEGVLFIKHEKNDKPRFVKDPNRGVVYNGKLVVLVDQFSASASEVLASTLQEYRRAIIVGTNTYGKATMQQIFPLDSLAELKNTNKYYSKITTGTLYKINKYSYQGVGVTPDIIFPTLYKGDWVTRESNEPYYIKLDSVQKTAMEVKRFPPIDMSKIRSNSLERIKESNWEQKLNLLSDSIQYYYCGKHTISLSLQEVFKWETRKNNFYTYFGSSPVLPFTQYNVTNTSLYNLLLKNHTEFTKPNQKKIQEMKDDFRLYETVSILFDYISQP